MALRAGDVLNGATAVGAGEDKLPGGQGRNILANELVCRGYHVRRRRDRAGAIAVRANAGIRCRAEATAPYTQCPRNVGKATVGPQRIKQLRKD
jgi:hypothetical protein